MFNLNFFRVSKSTWYVQMGLSYCHLMGPITQQPPASTESNAFKMIHSQVTSAGPSAERSYRTIVLGQVGLLLGEEDTGHVTIENHLTNLLFLMFSSFFSPLFSIVLHQPCLLHQVRATSCHILGGQLPQNSHLVSCPR